MASRARSATTEQEPLLARARVRTPSGTWLVVRAIVLSGDGSPRTAVTIEPARAHDLAPLIADAYGLTDRERAVTQLVAQGLATAAIAARLYISPWTVQDHLKSIFEKVGVSTRGELVARMFFEHYAPRLAEDALLDEDGWFGLPQTAERLSRREQAVWIVPALGGRERGVRRAEVATPGARRHGEGAHRVEHAAGVAYPTVDRLVGLDEAPRLPAVAGRRECGRG